MKKILLKNENEVLKTLKEGKRVEGRLMMEETEDGKFVISFKAYDRKHGRRAADRLLLRLEHGWVKESKQRIKVFDSLPKGIGPVRMSKVLSREMESAGLFISEIR